MTVPVKAALSEISPSFLMMEGNMLDLLITFDDGESIISDGWSDRPMKQLLSTIGKTFPDVESVVILKYTPITPVVSFTLIPTFVLAN
jgi:hypothetical protein